MVRKRAVISALLLPRAGNYLAAEGAGAPGKEQMLLGRVAIPVEGTFRITGLLFEIWKSDNSPSTRPERYLKPSFVTKCNRTRNVILFLESSFYFRESSHVAEYVPARVSYYYYY